MSTIILYPDPNSMNYIHIKNDQSVISQKYKFA